MHHRTMVHEKAGRNLNGLGLKLYKCSNYRHDRNIERKQSVFFSFFLQLVAFPQVVVRFTSMAAALSIEYYCTMAESLVNMIWSPISRLFD